MTLSVSQMYLGSFLGMYMAHTHSHTITPIHSTHAPAHAHFVWLDLSLSCVHTCTHAGT
jgi:hypothetical protein